MSEEEKEKSGKIAVALGYEDGVDEAPRILAKGQDYIADQIIALAKENGLHIHEDADLAEILSVLELDSYIPIEAYVTVAEILSYVYKENEKNSKI